MVDERMTGSADSKCATVSSVATTGATEAGWWVTSCNGEVFEVKPSSLMLELDMSALLA